MIQLKKTLTWYGSHLFHIAPLSIILRQNLIKVETKECNDLVRNKRQQMLTLSSAPGTEKRLLSGANNARGSLQTKTEPQTIKERMVWIKGNNWCHDECCPLEGAPAFVLDSFFPQRFDLTAQAQPHFTWVSSTVRTM